MKPLQFAGLTLAVCGCVLLAAAARQAAGGNDHPDGYHVANTVPLPDAGGWDYLGIDTAHRNLYISHSPEEVVYNMDKQAVVGKIEPAPGTHGVAISEKDGHGFTSNGGQQSSTTEFDLTTLATIKQIPLPIGGADGIIYDSATDRVFIFNHQAQAVAVEASSGDVAGVVTLPSRAAEYAVADGQGHVYDNLEDSSQEIEIDSRTLKVTETWPLAPCEGPSGLDMDRKTRRLFVGCHGGGANDGGVMAVVNADNGKVVATVPIGGGVDATRFDPGTKLAFSSNGGGTGSITVIHEDSADKFTLVGNIPTEAGARTMEVDTKTHTLYTVTAKYGPPAPPPPAPPAGSAPEGRGRGRGGRAPMIPGSFHLLVIPK